MNIKNKGARFVLAVLVFCAVLSCKRNEFMPEPVGAEIPYAAGPDISTALSASPYTLFKAAWERSNMNKILADEFPKNRLTVLVPSDAAMTKAGFTAAVIGKTDPKALDTLLRYHILNGEYTVAKLTGAQYDQAVNTLLIDGKYTDGVVKDSQIESVPYAYKQYLNVEGSNLLINGKTVPAGKESPISRGILVPVESVLAPPKRSMLQALKADGRFGLFLKAAEINGQLYDGFLIETFDSPQVGSILYMLDANHVTPGDFAATRKSDVIRFTLFAPTDEAFHKVGIYSAADIEQLNSRSPYTGDSRTLTPSDSLLILHRQGFAYNNLDIDWDTFAGAAIYVTPRPSVANMVFYGNALNAKTLGSYIVRDNFSDDRRLYLGLDFGKDGSGKTTIRQTGSPFPAATVIEENINTQQGPIHVLDRLLVPKDFKLPK